MLRSTIDKKQLITEYYSHKMCKKGTIVEIFQQNNKISIIRNGYQLLFLKVKQLKLLILIKCHINRGDLAQKWLYVK